MGLKNTLETAAMAGGFVGYICHQRTEGPELGVVQRFIYVIWEGWCTGFIYQLDACKEI